MSQTPSKPRLQQMILAQLSHPLKLRVVLCAAMMTAWYALFFSPLTEDVAATTARIDRERRRGATAREIEQLKKTLAPFEPLIPAGADVEELMRHVIDHIRSPLKLISLKPEKPKDLGPYEAIGLQLNLQGGFAEIDRFLAWVETDRRLLRIDALKLDPAPKDPSLLSAQILLLSLSTKPEAAAKTKAPMSRKP
jgi:Tfp pilus assembly protein PilO